MSKPRKSKAHRSKPHRSEGENSNLQTGKSPPRTMPFRVLGALIVVVAALVIVGFKVIGSRSATPPAASDDPAAQIEWVERNKKPALIVYHSTNCVPCLKMEALVKTVRRDYEPKVTFIDVLTNVEANVDLWTDAGIRSIPTSDFLSASGEKNRVVGLMVEQDLRAELARLASGK